MKIFISKLNPKTKGETIIEVLTAVVILTIVLTTAFTILNRALYANVDNRNRVIALNIAREGIEAVRNIRDTNWLKYSGDRRGKWLCLDRINENTCDGSGTDDFITDIWYIVFYKEGRYYLLSNKVVDAEGNTNEALPTQELDLNDTSEDFFEYRLYRENDANGGRYTHNPRAGGGATPFHRQIELRVINPNTSDIKANPSDSTKGSYCGTSASCANAALHVTSRVQWKEGEAVQKAVLETVLFDFYEREEY